MFGRIKKYKRYKDYFAVETLEVKSSLICVLIFLLFERVLGLYKNIHEFSDALMNLILYVISGEFCLFGMVLAGMALIVSIITKPMREQMQKQNAGDMSERILSQFEFSAANLVIQILCLFLIYLTLASKKNVLNKIWFYSILVLVVYHLSFNIFYILQLLGNCIKLNNIKDKCDAIERIDKSMIDTANEIRIDYILALILREKGMNRTEFLKTIDEMVEKSNYVDHRELKTYIHNYYEGKM